MINKDKVINLLKKRLNNIPLYSALCNAIVTSNISSAYIVGGTLRDLFIKGKFKDLDVVLPKALLFSKRFAKEQNAYWVPLDAEQGVARVISRDKSYEIDFAEIKENITQDLWNRDFTINALAIELSSFLKDEEIKILDLFSGLNHIQEKTLVFITPHAPYNDPLRVLRAFRLGTTLKFRLTSETINLIKNTKHLLTKVAKERIQVEFLKILSSPKSFKYLKEMFELNCFSYFLNGITNLELYKKVENLLPHLLNLFPDYEFKKYLDTSSSLIKFTSLFWEEGITAKALLKKATKGGHFLKLSNKENKRIHYIALGLKLWKSLSPAPSKTIIYRAHRLCREDFAGAIILSYCNFKNTSVKKLLNLLAIYYQELLPVIRKNLITGNELISLGIPQGPIFKNLLNKLKEAQIEGKIATSNEAMEWVRNYYIR